MKQFKTIELIVEGPMATIWFNRPEVRNGFNETMIAEVSACLDALRSNDQIRILMFKGRGKSFSAGADLNWLGGVRNYSFEQNYKESITLAQCFHTIYSYPKITITVAHGASIGGANGFLSASDYAFCEHETIFSLSEVKIGIVPSCISPYVYKRIGEYVAKELMLSGKRINGMEAEKIGLVNKSLDQKDLDEYVNAIIQELLSSGPKAAEATKDLLYEISNKKAFTEAPEYTANMIAKLRASGEGQEGMAAFLEKRKTNWNNTN